MSRFYTAKSPIHGTGVFSSAQFSPGEIILKIDDTHPNSRSIKPRQRRSILGVE